MRLKLFLAIFIAYLFLTVPSVQAQTTPKNMILFIGDGMGFEHVTAAGMYANGAPGTLVFESFPYQTQVITYSADAAVTDSAAAATAMATGQKVNNLTISVAQPGDGSPLQTVLEYYQTQGKMTGLVTTTFITHATPAAFAAHESDRNSYTQIAQDILVTRPNVMMGGGTTELSVIDAQSVGYTAVTNRIEMQSLNTEASNYVFGHFGLGHLPYEYDGLGDLPHLSEMTTTALNILDNDPDGFFLVVEGGRIDHAAHDQDLLRNIPETVEFANAVQAALNWANGRSDTLIAVTADHETGGLTIQQNNGQGNYPTATFTTNQHTAQNVPLYATGPNAETIATSVIDNTEVYQLLAPVTVLDIARPDLTCDAAVRIMPVGNSITQGYDGVQALPVNEQIGYRKTLYDLLSSAGYNFDLVGSRIHGDSIFADPQHEGDAGKGFTYFAYNNSGQPAATPAESRIYGYLDANPPDVILLHLGTNDLNNLDREISTIVNNANNLLNIIDAWEADNNQLISVVAAQIINRNEPFQSTGVLHERTSQFNDALATLISTRIVEGDEISLVNMETGANINYLLVTNGGDMIDNLHPAPSGQNKMAQVWFTELTNILPNCSTSDDVTIVSTPITSALVGQVYTYDVDSIGTAPITYTLDQAPAGMTIDANTGVITWIPATSANQQIIVRASNGVGTDDTQSFIINVQEPPNTPPTADAGLDVVVLDGDENGVEIVTLDGSASADVDGTIASYVWTENGVQIATGTTADVSFNVGIHLVTLTVTDDDGATATDDVVVQVSSSTPSLRVSDGLVVLYDFESIVNNIVPDVSNVGTPLNLTIRNPAGVSASAGVLTISSPTLIDSDVPPAKVLDAVTLSNEITVEAWVAAANITQDGPARLVTISPNSSYRNLTLGQQDGTYHARLRTTQPTTKDFSLLATGNVITADVLHHVVYTRDAVGNTTIYIDGQAVATGTAAGVIGDWDATYRLALANETDGSDRSWLGDYHLLAIYGKALSAAEVLQNFDAGADGDSQPSNIVPTANAGADQTVTDNDNDGIEQVTLDASASFDSDGAIVSYVWNLQGNTLATGVTAPVVLGIGTHEIELVVTDDGGAVATDTVTIVVQGVQNQPPVADAGDDLVVNDVDGNGTETVNLDGSGSYDPDGTIISYTWMLNGTMIANGANPTVDLPTGIHTITLTVTDDQGLEASSDVTVTVTVTQPFTCPVDLASYWRLDETGTPTLFDDTASSNDATCTNCPNPVTGRVGVAADFDGVDDGLTVAVTNASLIGDSFDWARTDSFSFETWVNADAASCTTGPEVFMGRYEGGGNMALWLGCVTGGDVRFNVRDNNGVSNFIIYDTDIRGSGWQHIASVWDAAASELQLYVNGSLVATQAATNYTGNFYSTQNFTVGYFDGQYNFDGMLDEVAVYNKALEPVDVISHYQNGIGRAYCLPEGITDEPPVLTPLNYSAPDVIAVGSGPYIDPGASAIDAIDGDISSVAEVVRVLQNGLAYTGDLADITNTVDTYTIVYFVRDSGDNEVEASRVVNVVDTNIVPTANAGADQTVTDNDNDGIEQVTLDASASFDSDGAIVSYVWNLQGNPLAAGVTAPVVLGIGTNEIELVVTDDGGAVATDTVTIVVQPSPNLPPMANAGPDQTVQDGPEDDGAVSVLLDGSGSSDSDGTIAAYSWQENGTEIATGVNPTVSLATGVHELTLVVTDDDGAAATDTVTITVLTYANQPPAADAGADQTVQDGVDDDGFVTVTLDGTASSDLDGTIVNYTWTENDTVIATGAAPQVNLNTGVHTLTLTIADDDGATATDTVTITVLAYVNQPPAADAGVDQTVQDGVDDDGFVTVALDGSGSSDSDGAIVAYSWQENATEIVTGQTPSVQLAVGAHTLTLVVTDDDGATASDTVTITVEPYPNQPPVANAGIDRTVTDSDNSGAEFVTLDGSASTDVDGTIAAYSWRENGTEIAIGATPNVALAVGSHTLTLMVTDDDGATGTDTVIITVQPPQTVEADLRLEMSVAPELVDFGDTLSYTLFVTNDGPTIATNVNLQNTLPAGVTFVSVNPAAPTCAASGVMVNCNLGTLNPGDTRQVVIQGFIEPITDTYTVQTTNNSSYVLPNMTVTHTLPAGAALLSSTPTAPTCSESSGVLTCDFGPADPNEMKTVQVNIAFNPPTTLVNTATVSSDQTDPDTANNTASSSVTLGEPIPNQAPIAEAGDNRSVYDADNSGVEDVLLDATGSRDLDGTITSYAWVLNDVTVSTEAVTTQSLPVGVHTFTLIVTDDDGVTGTDTVTITVEAFVNQPPTANAGLDQVVVDRDADGSELVTLDGSGSSDADGSITSYVWTENDVEIATGVAPSILLNAGVHNITLTVTDDYGATATDNVTITVQPNQPPVANAGPDQTVQDGMDDDGMVAVTLDGSGSSDADGSIASYVWTEGAVEVATVAAPTVNLTVGTHTLTLTVTDNDGATASDTVTIIVEAYVNQPPTANAGPDQTVQDGMDDDGVVAVTLDGSGSSDADGSVASYVWTENSVEIAIGANPTVNLTVGTHTLTLTVTDDDGATASDAVTIIVEAYVNQPPTANAGPDQSVQDVDGSGSEAVTLDGSGSGDVDGTIASYTWTENNTVIANGVTPVVDLPNGTHVITLTVTDDDGATATATVTITVTAIQSIGRVTDDLLVLYDFETITNNVVPDVSGFGTPLDLTIRNPAGVTASGGVLTINSPTLIDSDVPPTKILDAVIASNEVTIEAWVAAANITQDGPARLVTISPNPSFRNLTLGQQDGAYHARLRTTQPVTKDFTLLATGDVIVQNVLQHVVYTRDTAGNTTIYVDGQVVATGTAAGVIGDWDATYRLALANETDGSDRSWLGDYHLLAIYGKALSAAEVLQNFDAGESNGATSNLVPVITVNPITPVTVVDAQASTELVSGQVMPVLAWKPLISAGTYQVLLVDAADTVLIDQTLDAALVCQQDGCRYTPTLDDLPVGLVNGTYFWWLRAGTGEWQQAATFTVAVPPPAVPQVDVVVEGGSARLIWADDPYAVWFQVNVTGSDGATAYQDWHAKTCQDNTCSFVVPLPAGTYTAYLQAWGPGGTSQGDLGGWSAGVTFVIP